MAGVPEGERTWGLTQFCEHYKRYAKTLRRSMRQQHRAGEKLFVDFAGPTLALADGSRGQVFVAAMGASSYTFACVTADQTMRSWLSGIQRTLRFLGGVPQLIVPDNPRALIADANRYEPRVNDTVLDFCRHYDVSMLPARPYAPQDKAKVESAVQVVERWILARLRHERLADEKMQSKPLARPRISSRDRSIRQEGVDSGSTVNLTVKILGSTARENLPSLEFPA